jgi:hypothetical protein
MLRTLLLAASMLTAIGATQRPAAAQMYSCRGYPPREVVAEIKVSVEALRRIEREAADRGAGLDTRPYEWLLDQARAAESAIAVPSLLAAEDELERCRNSITRVRRGCAGAAAALVRVIEELVADKASRERRLAYAQVMPHCERWMSLAPLKTTFRVTD